MVIGGTVVDITATARDASSVSMLNSSFPGTTRISLGGVGRNVAEAICKLNADGCIFVSAVGGGTGDQGSSDAASEAATADDFFGSWLVSEIERKGIVSLGLIRVKEPIDAFSHHHRRRVCMLMSICGWSFLFL